MQIDWYTKAMLTVIGFCLLGLLLRPVLMPEKVDARDIIAVDIVKLNGYYVENGMLRVIVEKDSMEAVTKEVVQQYEAIRSLGPCEMIDINCVLKTAKRLNLNDLAGFIEEFGSIGYYRTLQDNYSDWLEKYDIKHPSRVK